MNGARGLEVRDVGRVLSASAREISLRAWARGAEAPWRDGGRTPPDRFCAVVLSARDSLAVEFDLSDVSPSALAMAARRHQIAPPKFVDLTEIHFVEHRSHGHDAS